MDSGSLWNRRALVYLIVAYTLSFLVHLSLLYRAAAVPRVFWDEWHYAVTGDNILFGRGYTIRGGFSNTVPPLQPLFIAAAHGIGGSHARDLYFVLACAIICCSIFFVYRLSREFGLGMVESVGFGLAWSFLPQTAFAATYMSEVLQFPLFFFSFLLAVKWLKSPCVRSSLELGLVLGIMALCRYATGTYVAIVGAVAIGSAVLEGRRGIRQRVAGLLIVLGCYFFFQGGWWIYKIAHGATALGAYGGAWNRLPYRSWRLMTAYIGDSLWAAGPLTALLLFWGVARLRREHPHAALLIAVTSVVLVLSTAYFDGGATGFIRERYFIYAVPLMALMARLGIDHDTGLKRVWHLTLIGIASAVALGAALLHHWTFDPGAEAAWMHLLGTWRLTRTSGDFNPNWLLLNGLVLVVASLLVLGRIRALRGPVFTGLLLILNVSAFASVIRPWERYTTDEQHLLAPVMRVLSEVKPGARLALSSTAGLTDGSVLTIEILKRVDLRVASSLAQLPAEDIQGRQFLTTRRFDRLRQVRQEGGFRLYEIPKGSSGAALLPTDEPPISSVAMRQEPARVRPATGPLSFYAIDPCRVLDTRSPPGLFGGPRLSARKERQIPIPESSCNVPHGVEAYSLNLTVVPSGQLGWLNAWATGQPMPVTSVLNALNGAITANTAIVRSGNGGSISVLAAADTDLVIDISGYFTLMRR